jgi:hypothetical protein
MTEKHRLEYFLVRYVPNAVRGEFVNIGLVMTESGGGFAGAHFTADWRRVKCLDPSLDIEMMDALILDVQERVKDTQSLALLLGEMSESYSNTVQISTIGHCVAENPEQELRDLAAKLVEIPILPDSMADEIVPAGDQTQHAGRKWIHSAMKDAFKLAGVLPFLDQRISVKSYTNETDRFTFDFAYAIGKNSEETKVFHAVSLVGKSNETEMFPLRVAKIGPKMARLKKTQPTFTAVVEDHYDASDPYVMSILAFMNDENIRVSAVREMPAIAATAKEDLGI